MTDSPPSPGQGSGPVQVDVSVQVANALAEVVALIDAGVLTATSAERAHLVGAVAGLRTVSDPTEPADGIA